MDDMECPHCDATAKRDPYNRDDRFVCSNCGWVSWHTRIELLQEFVAAEQKNESQSK